MNRPCHGGNPTVPKGNTANQSVDPICPDSRFNSRAPRKVILVSTAGEGPKGNAAIDTLPLQSENIREET
jgi:hypothetical protein